MEKCDLIVKGKYVLPMDTSMSIINDGLIAVSGNTILEVGTQDELDSKYEAKEMIDAGNSIIMPGLINTHTHAAMTYFRGLADDLPLQEWWEKHMFPAEKNNINKEFIKKATELAVLEMIKSGTTMFNNMYFFENETAKVAEASGIRAMLGEGILNFPTPSCNNGEEAIKETLNLEEKYRDSELISVGLAPHSIYTCSKELLIKVSDISKELNIPIHIHISETKKEIEDCRKENSKTPVEYLDEIGLLNERTISAHSVWLTESDIKIFKKRKVSVSHNPISNMKLASGIMSAAKMIDKKITVGIGTDGVASNNTLDMFSDIRTCALLHKVNDLEPTRTNAREVIKMATLDGARVLGKEKEIGSLEKGKKADIITINLDKAHLSPMYDPFSHLVYCVNGGDVVNTIINGEVVMRDGVVKTVDEGRVLEEANDYRIK